MGEHSTHFDSLTMCRNLQGQVRILQPCQNAVGELDPARPLGYNPVQHLAIALGCCISEFARRFLIRRDLPTTVMTTLDWQVDGRRCQIARIDVHLRVDAELDAEDRHVLGRMVNQCPVHQALHGNVPIHLHLLAFAPEDRHLMAEV